VKRAGPPGNSTLEHLFLWLGGAAFVGSLACCAWVYLRRFGVTRAPARHLAGPLLFNAAIFGLFAAHHSLFARPGIKRAMTRIIPQRLIRSVYVWIASALLAAACLLWRPVGGDLYLATGVRTFGHAAIQLAGLWLTVRSVRRIDALDLAGIRMTTRSGLLQVAGPYRIVRHPLYLGWMLMVFGAGHMTGDRLAFAVITSAYLVFAIPWEERSLQAEFGAAYAAYAGRVRWRVIPYVY